ncbi:hypothetical protein Zmor_001667 [Zophobas morio]|uniref:Uncharacterized protein n=1 Tax=Zophobas morio TaxID=2755281 RepID=A0AA38J4B1_9CUCU|nr:hypothetical protein Zmor_001667 [Zophobas morio]
MTETALFPNVVSIKSVHSSGWFANAASRFFWIPQSTLLTDDESPIIAVRTRKSSREAIGVVSERHMGLFRNNTYNIVQQLAYSFGEYLFTKNRYRPETADRS